MDEQLADSAFRLHTAMAWLAARCDMAEARDDEGFNKGHAPQGHLLASIPPSDWLPADILWAWQQARFYRGQLSAMPFDYRDIPQPPDENGLTRKKGRFVTARAVVPPALPGFAVYAPRHKATHDAIKAQLPADGREFSDISKCWFFPASYAMARALPAFAVQHGFAVSDSALALIESILAQGKPADYVEPGAPLNPLNIRVANGMAQVRFPYDPGLVAEVKAITGRRFNGDNPSDKFWTVPLTAESVAALKAMAHKYGFDIPDELQAPAAAQPSQPPANPRTMKVTGKTLEIRFPYDPDCVNDVKAIPGRKFVANPDDKHWVAPINAQTVPIIVTIAKMYEFDYPASLETLAQEFEQQRAQRLAASRAEHSDFDVQGLGGTLRPFQRASVRGLLDIKRGYLGDEMGLGKTVSALATIQAAQAYPAVVVCPASLKLNWQREAAKWLPGHSISVLNGKAPNYSADIIILNYDILDKHMEALLALDIQAVVFDEFHYCKNHKAQRTKLAKQLAARSAQLRLGLSGSPVLNRPSELIPQLDILGRLDDMGGFWYFAEHYCNAYRTNWGWDLSGAANLEELNREMRAKFYIRRDKASVLKELPAKQRCQVTVDLSNRKEYEQAQEDLIEWLQQQAVTDPKFLASIADLEPDEQALVIEAQQEAAADSADQAEQLVRIEALKRLAAEGKLEAAKEWIETLLDSGEKLVVMAWHQDIVKAVAGWFDAPMIMGGQPEAVRQAGKDRFQTDPDCRVIVCNIQAGGVGHTLTAASKLLFIEQAWGPKIMEQAEDRIHRIGQEYPVTIYNMIASNTIDEQIAALIEAKRAVTDTATDGVQTGKSVSVLKELVAGLLAQGE